MLADKLVDLYARNSGLRDKLVAERDVVLSAARSGRIKGKKVGHTWALLGASVRSYRVAAHRVAAGRAAHRG